MIEGRVKFHERGDRTFISVEPVAAPEPVAQAAE
jgi:hypothetical protein